MKKGTYDAARKLLEEIIGKFDDNATKAVSDYVDFVGHLDELSNPSKNHLGVDTNNLVCRYQGYSSRGGEPLKVFAQLYVVHKACAEESNNLLVGCNIVAAENGEKSMLYYRLHMEMFAVLATKFPKVPTSLHAGELTLGLGRPEHLTYHIGRAVDTAKAHRIGHGVDLPFEQDSDELLKVMEDKKIPVEINLTSNEFILGVKDSEHPISLYHKAGVPVLLCTDDPGILRTSLTEQYVLAALRYGFSYGEMKEFAHNAISYSFLTATEREELGTQLDELFTEFEKKF